jgi:YesN/AraC family two-component response regulator
LTFNNLEQSLLHDRTVLIEPGYIMMKVLIVEDDAPSRMFMKDTVESQGFETIVTENGLLGFEAFKQFSPDLILSDIRMPKMDGLQLLQEIRKIDRRVIMVMTTAYGCEEYAVKALRLKANNYLKKPLRHKELLPLLKKYAGIVDRRTNRKKPPEEEDNLKLTLQVSNNISEIPNTADKLIIATGDALDETDKQDACLSLVELLTNAVEHGNLDNHTRREI